jgi:hypothetical protein
MINGSGAAFVCVHIHDRQDPILQAIRTNPAFPEDTGWQFLCGRREEHAEEEARIWSLDEVRELDPSLDAWLEYPAGTQFFREAVGAPWSRTRVDPES